MTSFGIKVSRPGFDVKTAAPNELSFSSAYKTLKVQSSGSGTLTQSTRSVTIAHNLGYVPLFMVHSNLLDGFPSTDYFLLPAGVGAGNEVGNNILAYADATNLYIKAQTNVGLFTFGTAASANNYGEHQHSGGNFTDFASVGDNPIEGLDDAYFRFPTVTISQGTTVYSAQIKFYINHSYGSGTVRATIKGIAEDNTAAFNVGTAPDGRSKTTASYAASTSSHGAGTIWTYNIENIVNEVFARAGWASGNALAVGYLENGSDAGNSIDDTSGSGGNSRLEIQLSSTIANYKYTIFLNQLE
jgi:hypothetical protein